ncbi:hypothetical protein K439DRAFT_1306929, partial [Ramaria rubella]
IPHIDVLMATLDQYSSDNSIFPAVCAAAAKGHEILNKYYSLTDESVIYQVAMSDFSTLHTELWIDTAVSLVHEQWEHHYK